MQLLKSVEELKGSDNLVITIGSFDGVHRGHQDIFNALKREAKAVHGKSMVITFDPHPQVLLHPDTDFFQITPLKDKIEFIQDQGIDYLLVIPFTHQFAATSFSSFFKDFLINKLHIRALVMGPNHSIGKNREGKTETIREMCKENGVEVVMVPELILDNQPVRSSEIRKMIHEMDIEQAEKFLGRKL